MFHWQYQGHVEPISQEAESVTVDRWTPSDPVVVRPARFVAAVLAASLFFTPVVAEVEAVTVDQWHPGLAEPVREVPRAPTFESFVVDPLLLTQGETIPVDKWFFQDPIAPLERVEPIPSTPPPQQTESPVPTSGDEPPGEEVATAERLARIIVSDIILYNQEKFEASLHAGNIVDAMEAELAEGRSLFVARIDQSLRDKRDFLAEELLRVARLRSES